MKARRRFGWVPLFSSVLVCSVLAMSCAEGSTPAPDSETSEINETDDSEGSEPSESSDGTDSTASASGGAGGEASDSSESSAGAGGSAPLENPSPPTCQPGDPSAFPPPAATPRISLNKPVVASEGVLNPEGLVDGDYHNSATITRMGSPTADAPSWVSIDLGTGPSRVLAIWHDASYAVYNNNGGGSPAAYRFETSADSTDGIDGTWTLSPGTEVSENPVRSRGHAIEFTDQRWLRFVVTGVPETSASGMVNIDELAVHDLSNAEEGMADAWFFLGDSITLGAFKRDIAETQMFDEVLAAAEPDFFPALINGGIGGEMLGNALARLDQALELNPDFRYVAIAYGTNDAWGNKTVAAANFEAQLVQLVERIIDAGRVPVLARIPFADAAHSTLPEFNAVIDQVREDYELPCGPDLYTWFWENPRHLGTDLVHPIQQGNVEINRLWAEAAAAYYTAE